MEARPSYSILVPAPTAWPFLTALGISLAFAGLVMHPAVTVVGLILLLRSAVGWWYEVLPRQREECVMAAADPEIAVSGTPVDYLAGVNRTHIPLEVHPYWTGVWGGLAGSVAMAAVAVLFGLISQGSIWYPINLLAAGVVSSLADGPAEQLRHFSAIGLTAGTLIHVTASILVGLLYAVTLPMFPRGATWRSGLITPVLWSALIASTLGFINPTLNRRIHWGWFVGSQIAFGIVASQIVARTAKIATLQSAPLAARAGVEGQEAR